MPISSLPPKKTRLALRLAIAKWAAVELLDGVDLDQRIAAKVCASGEAIR